MIFLINVITLFYFRCYR